MAWYVVYRGRKPGVYATWVTCHQQVTGYPNCCYKSFSSKEEAIASFLESTGDEDVKEATIGSKKTANKLSWLHIIVMLEFIIITVLQ